MGAQAQDLPKKASAPKSARTGAETDLFARVRGALKEGGPERVFEQLLKVLEGEKKYKELFDAMAMRNRYELGLPLVQVGPATELPEEVIAEHERALAQACEHVGRLFVDDGDLVQGWLYLRAVGKPEEMRKALERIDPGTRRKDVQGIIEIAINEGVHPSRGLEMVVHHYGICNAITNLEQFQSTMRQADLEACVRLLIRTLYSELVDNIRAEIKAREENQTADGTLWQLIKERPQLFEHDAYYIDSSHLWSVVRFSGILADGDELDLVIELTEYGRRISKVYQYESEPPFEDYYKEQNLYLRGVRGLDNGDLDAVEQAAEHFLKKARRALEKKDADYPASKILTILSSLNRLEDAIEIAREFETILGPGRPFSPSVFELCQMARDFRSLTDAAHQRGDVVNYAAGMIQEAERTRRRPGVGGDATPNAQ